MALPSEPSPSLPPSPRLPAYDSAPPTYANVTAPPIYARTNTNTNPNSHSSFPSTLLLHSGTIQAADPISTSPQASKGKPIYTIRHVGPTLLYILDASMTEQARRGHDKYADVAYKIHRHDVGQYVLLPGPRGEDAGNGISLRASVSPKGMCYTARAIPEPDEGEKRRPEKSDRAQQAGKGLLLFRSDGTQLDGRRWAFCATRSERKFTAAVEKEPNSDNVSENKSSSKVGESGPKRLEFSETGIRLGDGVRELLVACWVARVWRWGDKPNEKGTVMKWARRMSDSIKKDRVPESC